MTAGHDIEWDPPSQSLRRDGLHRTYATYGTGPWREAKDISKGDRTQPGVLTLDTDTRPALKGSRS